MGTTIAEQVSATADAGAGQGGGKWLTHRPKEYTQFVRDWTYTRDHYTGDVLRLEKITGYLLQKSTGESRNAFRERCRNSDYTNHMAAIIDSLVGMMSNVDGDTSRSFGPPDPDDEEKTLGLGDPKTPGTEAARLYRNIDGEGTRYDTFWHQVSIELSLTLWGWLFVDPADATPVFRYLTPERVVNWRFDGDRLVEVLIHEKGDRRSSLRDAPTEESRYLHITTEGWQRFRKDKDDNAVPLGEFTAWSQGFVDENDRPIVPVRMIRLPMKRQVGYYLARKCNAVFNRESERDFLLRVANFPKFLVEGDQTAYNTVKTAFAEGNNLLHGVGHKFIAPDTASAELASKVIEEKSKSIYLTAFREYGDAAQQRTATEVRQDAAAGAAAYLSLLSSALDGAETWALHIAEQALFPKNRKLWFQASVERSRDFLPADPEVMIERMIKRVFGTERAVPLGRTAQVDAAVQIATWQGLKVDKDEIAAAVTSTNLIELMSAAITLDWPAALRVQVMGKIVAAQGIISPEEEVQLEDGSKRKLLEVLREQAMALAEARDTATRRDAEFFGARDPAAPAPKDPEQA